MEDLFNKEGFMDYVRETFHFDDETLQIIGNIVDYAIELQTSRDQICNFVSDLVNDIEFGEVAMFCPDSLLTNYGLAEKKQWLKNVDSINY